MNAIHNQSNNRNNNSSRGKQAESSQQMWDKRNSRDITCFHCGEKGHLVRDCPVIDKEQTLGGKTVWAKMKAMRGRDIAYDKNYVSNRYRGSNNNNNRGGRGGNSNNQPQSSSSSSPPSTSSSSSSSSFTQQLGSTKSHAPRRAVAPASKSRTVTTVSDDEGSSNGMTDKDDNSDTD